MEGAGEGDEDGDEDEDEGDVKYFEQTKLSKLSSSRSSPTERSRRRE